jgi:hypothetical protein
LHPPDACAPARPDRPALNQPTKPRIFKGNTPLGNEAVLPCPAGRFIRKGCDRLTGNWELHGPILYVPMQSPLRFIREGPTDLEKHRDTSRVSLPANEMPRGEAAAVLRL